MADTTVTLASANVPLVSKKILDRFHTVSPWKQYFISVKMQVAALTSDGFSFWLSNNSAEFF